MESIESRIPPRPRMIRPESLQRAERLQTDSARSPSIPAAATITQFAQLYDKHPGYTSIMNVMSVIFCIITMPIIVFIYQIL